MIKNTKDKEIHSGHRARLLNTVLKAELFNMQPVNVLEFILSYIIPRKDVNPIAHRLINEFGSVSNVIDADVESLMMVEGIGQRSAQMLACLSQIFEYYNECKLKSYTTLSNLGEVTDYFDQLLRMMRLESLVIVGVDSGCKIVGKKMVARGSSNSVAAEPLQIANFLAQVKAVAFYLAHNHPSGSAIPSEIDLKTHQRITEIAKMLNLNLIDNIIVGEDGVYSINRQEFLRTF